MVFLGLIVILLSGCGNGGGASAGSTVNGTGGTLSGAKAITAYSISGVAGTINETAKTIAVTLPSGTSGTALVATFTTTGTSVKVGAIAQASGTTANDFTNPVTYTVIAADGTTSTYTVTVTVTVAAKTLSAIAVIQTHPFTAYGPTEQFIAVGLYSDGSITDMTKSVAWSSSAPTVATVNSTGLATKAGFGSVTITANDPATGKAGSTVVSLATTTNFNAKAIAAGGTTVMALLPDGTIWGWGGNTYGQVGDGTSTNQSTPVRVPGLSNVAAIAVGGYHSAAIKLDGTVWAWGDNCCGQLGNGTSDGVATWPLPPHPTPVQVTGMTNAINVAAGLFHTVALKKDGTVWTWGYNAQGQLGNGTNNDSLVPVQVTSLASVTAVAVGGSFSLALKSDGTVWTWGYNPYGQLGNGTKTNSNVPVQVTGLTNVTAIAAGGSHVIAAKSDGTVWAWGFNANGQLGNNTKTDSTTPVQVSGLTNVTKVAAGGAHSIALKSDATAWVWGDNSSKQLGSAVTGTYSSAPVQYNGLTGVFDIAANFYDIYAVHHSTVTANGCGDNTDGQRGNGTTGGAGGCSDVTPGELYKSMVHLRLADIPIQSWVMFISDKDNNYTYDTKTVVTLMKPTATGDILPQSITSSDPSIIRADSDWGTIETVGAGTATITITWPDGTTSIQTITSR